MHEARRSSVVWRAVLVVATFFANFSSSTTTCNSVLKLGDVCGDGQFCVPSSTSGSSLHCVTGRSVRVIFYRHGFSCGNAVSWAPSAYIKAKLANLTKKYDDDAADLATGAVRDPALTDLGLSDSAAAKCPTVDFVASSTMRRAMQTAHLMFPNHSIHVVPSIGEMDDESEGDPTSGMTAEELPMSEKEQVEYLCGTEQPCWANYTFCRSLPAAPRAPVVPETTEVRQAVADVKLLLEGNESVSAWLKDTSPDAASVCGNGWPVAANISHFVHVLLPKILRDVPLPPTGAFDATSIAVVTHSTTMKRSLQPLNKMDYWPKSNEGVQLQYVVQPSGEVTELECSSSESCQRRLVECGVPYRKHQKPWPCSAVRSCGGQKAWVRDAIACSHE